ncbi:RNase H domain-containing protein [Trichonephila clavipes]|nr:RNase H domain-containing protein [Trichonephila clavipes]
MDKFLSRKRTFDDNKASTSAQTSIVPKIKSRKYSQEYLNFGFTITEVNGEEKPLCVICSKILAADSMKPNKLKRHFETLHVHTLSNDTVSRRIDDIAEDVEQQLFGKLRDKLFSIQHEEATDSNKDAHFIAYVRFWNVSVFSHLFSFYLHAGPLTTHFDGEVEAIHIALQQLAVRLPPIERAVILSDSTSALQALSNYNENNCLRVQNCRELLGKIKGKIVFQWVPSHCGIWGNERADFLAKKGTGIFQNFRRDLTLHSAKLEIKRIFGESFRLTTSRVARDKPWMTSPICVLCDTGQDMTAAHLDECSALNDLNCIVKRSTLNSHRATSLLVRLVEEEERWEVPDHPQNWGGIEPNRTVTCMVFEAEENDRRKSSPLLSMNFVALDLMLISVTVDQVA